MRTKTSARARLSVDDWVDAAVRRMVRSGIQGVEVIHLARDLRVTKGSFYWHFRNRAALLEAILRRWRLVTVTFNDMLETEEPDAIRRLQRLLHLPEERRDAVDQANFEWAVRDWSRHSARTRATVLEVDRLRHKMYLRLFRQLGAVDGHADALARICWAVAGRLWGSEESRLSAKSRRELIDTAVKLLTDSANSRRGARAGRRKS